MADAKVRWLDIASPRMHEYAAKTKTYKKMRSPKYWAINPTGSYTSRRTTYQSLPVQLPLNSSNVLHSLQLFAVHLEERRYVLHELPQSALIVCNSSQIFIEMKEGSLKPVPLAPP